MITIAEVIEEAAQEVRAECIGFADDDMQLNRIIAAIRALAAQYEGCIVAEGKPVLFAVPWQSQDQSSLYRAKQPETCKPALQVERADARRGRWLLDQMRHQNYGPNSGWTLTDIYPGDDAAAAIDAAMEKEPTK
jgi:hypothetical protein